MLLLQAIFVSAVLSRKAKVELLPDHLANPLIIGTVEIVQENSTADSTITLTISGLTPGSEHGWHIHSKPVASGTIHNCSTTEAHFNPLKSKHGDRKNAADARHYGDLGNFVVDNYGSATVTFTDHLVSLFGDNHVTGIGLVIHNSTDDLGLGGDATSVTTGNAGSRLACGNIVLVGADDDASNTATDTGTNTAFLTDAGTNTATDGANTASATDAGNNTASATEAGNNTASATEAGNIIASTTEAGRVAETGLGTETVTATGEKTATDSATATSTETATKFATSTSTPLNETQISGLNITGYVIFDQNSSLSLVGINFRIVGLAPNSTHGWHIHANPVVEGYTVNCSTTGGHFNPLFKNHGDPNNTADARHYGDLGNFVTDSTGSANINITDALVSLYGNYSVSGLGLVIHEQIDDLGLGGATNSLTTGNAGSRLACGNIIISNGPAPFVPELVPSPYLVEPEPVPDVLIGNCTLTPDFNSTSLTVSASVVVIQPNASSPAEIELVVTGLPPNSTHGWHIHEFPVAEGEIVNCSTTGGHFNPLLSTHGDRTNDSTTRHVGDLGNFDTDNDGSAIIKISDTLVTLYGNLSVIGKSFVIHSGKDDLGLGSVPASLTTGNAGSRLACGNIVGTIITPGSGAPGTTYPPGGSGTLPDGSGTQTEGSEPLVTLPGGSGTQTEGSEPLVTPDSSGTKPTIFGIPPGPLVIPPGGTVPLGTQPEDYPPPGTLPEGPGSFGTQPEIPGDYPLGVSGSQCGGTGFSGTTTCAEGNNCQVIRPSFSQCLPGTPDQAQQAPEFAQCGGIGMNAGKPCAPGLVCQRVNSYYSQCLAVTSNLCTGSN